MANIYAPLMRALVIVTLVLATATLMFVAVSTARASSGPAIHTSYSNS
jgi:multisubunit Na+/H+ antiporter MnhC subunit